MYKRIRNINETVIKSTVEGEKMMIEITIDRRYYESRLKKKRKTSHGHYIDIWHLPIDTETWNEDDDGGVCV